MALVMLPCDLPWWPTLQQYFTKLLSIKHTIELIDGMAEIYELCNVSLDPDDEELKDPDLFIGLLNFLDNDLSCEERNQFFSHTLPNIINRALLLKQWKPGAGLHFSLQQQADCTDISYNFISALIAHCFFSTFPRRNEKTHPTLQDFNFTFFFKTLDTNSQKAKLRSILFYFDWLETEGNSEGTLTVSRQVMTSKEWLTIEDWLECPLPLCPVLIKHESKLEYTDPNCLHICFSSAKIGGHVLSGGYSQECILFATFPELLAGLLNIEILEDNEVLSIQRVRHVTRILDPKGKAAFEKVENVSEVNVCCIDPDDYTKVPICQYETDNILRELNKCLLGFQQKNIDNLNGQHEKVSNQCFKRRLSPIGESFSSTPSEAREREKKNSMNTAISCNVEKQHINNTVDSHKYRRQFITLGSSGECLPINRVSKNANFKFSLNSNSSEEEYFSANCSFETEDAPSEVYYELNVAERRNTFKQRLEDALQREENSYNSSTDEFSNHTKDPSVQCTSKARFQRADSGGFVLNEKLSNTDPHEQVNFSYDADTSSQHNLTSIHSRTKKNDSSNSSTYSFSTECSSHLEELYEQFSHWLENPILDINDGNQRQLVSRDWEVVNFAASLLKRTLSESFAGVPVLNEENKDFEDANNDRSNSGYIRNKLLKNTRCLSLELAKQKHLLAAQLLSQLGNKSKNGLKIVSSGNYGCGNSRAGDVQLKLIIQWLSASVAEIPALVYYTAGHKELSTVDTLCRIIYDRKWTVKDLAQETLQFAASIVSGKIRTDTLFSNLLGLEPT